MIQQLEGCEFVVLTPTPRRCSKNSRSTAPAQPCDQAPTPAPVPRWVRPGGIDRDGIVERLSGYHILAVITAGMGGGTSAVRRRSYLRPPLELGILTVSVVTKPFHFEGSRRRSRAVEAIEGFQSHVDTLIIIPNQNLFRLLRNEKTTFTEAFALADGVLLPGRRA